MENKLSILIATFNRKEKLRKTLEGLQNQTNSNFEIIISDNCSNYLVSDIFYDLKVDFIKRITIHVQPFNIGMIGNVSGLFLLPKTNWMWMLSDDDEVLPDAVQTIYDEIDVCNNVGCISFATFDYTKESYDIKSLTEFIDVYSKLSGSEDLIHGDLVFMSNKVYNLNIIKPYLGYAFTYGYTYIMHIIPIFIMLNNKAGNFKISNHKIVNYEYCEDCQWNYETVTLGLRTFADIPLNVSKRQRNALNKIVIYSYIHTIRRYIRYDFAEPKRYLQQMYYSIYRNTMPIWWVFIYNFLRILPKNIIPRKIILKIYYINK